MRVDELDISEQMKGILHSQGYHELHPPQAEAVPKALAGRNLVVSIPTASGKSLIGYLAALKTVLSRGRRVLYIVPLKALASEKRDELGAFSSLGVKVALSIGDLDSEDVYLKDADILVATSEKADSLLRHGNRFMEEVGLVIADEVHLIHDPGRGPTLEVALTKMIRRSRDLQVIALSATISNATEMAEWLDAELVQSDWRPVPLREGVYLNGEVQFSDGGIMHIEGDGDPLWKLISSSIREGGQCLVFVNSRRSTESVANSYRKHMATIVGQELSDEDRDVLQGEGEPTSIGRKLAQCVASGIAFHHAGLSYGQRKLVEDSFKEGKVRCIVATPTLAAGINLPARRVVVRDTGRFDANAGFVSISVMEVKQMCGRAGRPRYDPYGEAILMAKTEDEKYHLMEEYLHGEAEGVFSKLSAEPVLRSHVLGLLATGDASSAEDIMSFLKDTFYGHQSALWGLEDAVDGIIDLLMDHGMAQMADDGRVIPTLFGKRVSDLYIDPQSALILRDSLEGWKDDADDLAILQAVCSTPDVMSIYLRKKDQEWMYALYDRMEGSFLTVPPDDENEFQFFLSDLKVASMLLAWMNEEEEESILSFYSAGPGDLRNRADSAEWLLYSMQEIAKMFRPEAVPRLSKMLLRIRHGIKEELTELVTIKGVGRSRARTLYRAGYTDKGSIVKADARTLAKLPLIGPILATSILRQLGAGADLVVEPEPAMEEDTGPYQSNLFDF